VTFSFQTIVWRSHNLAPVKLLPAKKLNKMSHVENYDFTSRGNVSLLWLCVVLGEKCARKALLLPLPDATETDPRQIATRRVDEENPFPVSSPDIIGH
jgi:hypothetical protein